MKTTGTHPRARFYAFRRSSSMCIEEQRQRDGACVVERSTRVEEVSFRFLFYGNARPLSETMPKFHTDIPFRMAHISFDHSAFQTSKREALGFDMH